MKKYTIMLLNKFRSEVHLEFVEATCLQSAINVTKKLAVEAIGGVEHNWQPLYMFQGHCEEVNFAKDIKPALGKIDND